MQEKIIILDFGSQTTQLIGRRLRELNVYCEIVPYNKFPHDDESVKGVILSGSPFSVYDENAFKVDLTGIRGKYPILGICYGAQFISYTNGGKVEPAGSREYGRAHLQTFEKDNLLFHGVRDNSQVWMSHGDTITAIPDNFKVIASTDKVRIAAYQAEGEQMWGVQFHPEVFHSEDGTQMLRNFVVEACGCHQTWSPASFVDTTVAELKEQLGNDRVLFRSRVGYVNWGYEAIGRFDSWEQIANYPVDNDRKGNRTVVPGDIMYKDQNNDGVINYLDERPIGYRVDSTPTLNFGINLSASWKGFDLAMDWTGSGMTSWNQCYETARPFQNDGNSPDEVLKDAWHLSDIWDANSPLIPGKYPMVRLNTDETSAYDKSSYWLHNVTYLKLRNLEVGYTFPKTWLNRTGISNLRLFVSGTNLLTLSNLSVMDPECASDNGLDYPPMRVINIGVNLKF